MNIPIHHRDTLPGGRLAGAGESRGNWHLLVALDLFTAVCALGGGLALVARPDGSLLQMPLWMLQGSPFTDYLVPGLVLASVIGGGHLWGGLLVLRRARAAPLVSLAAGVAMLGWMVVQLTVFRGRMWLQPAIVLLGAAVVGTALSVRSPPELWRDLRGLVVRRPR